jgi:signal transduction histidine kinase
MNGQRPQRPRLGLRARITTAFGLGALLLSVTLAVLSYGITRRYLLREAESSAVRQAYVNARLVRDGRQGRTDVSGVAGLLSRLDTPSGSESVLFLHGQAFSGSVAIGSNSLPRGLRTTVQAGTPARQRFNLDGEPHLAVGVPIPAVDAVYFEVFTLADINRTLNILGIALTAAAAVTTAGGLLVGQWASRRVLQPVRVVSRAAENIASGHLETRLEVGDDKDLASLASSFNAMVDALQTRIERDARFASDVSHELRSPLTTLTTALGVLESRRDELSDRSRQALDLLSGDLSRFQRLVQDLLEISRFDVGAEDLALEDVRVGELVIHAVESHADASVPVQIEGAAADAVVRADKRRLERVLANLVENADAHGCGVTGVGVALSNGSVRISVDDAGPGVSAEDRERVFERFARGRAEDRRTGGSGGGVGLGLSLVKEHVRVHGGKVWVEDRPGGGARFVVELPAEKEHEKEKKP